MLEGDINQLRRALAGLLFKRAWYMNFSFMVIASLSIIEIKAACWRKKRGGSLAFFYLFYLQTNWCHITAIGRCVLCLLPYRATVVEYRPGQC